MDTASNVSLVATDLVNPRGMAFDPNGKLHVAIGGSPGPNAGVAIIEDGCPRVLAGGFPTARVAFRAIAGMADVAVLDDRLYALLAGGNIDDGAMPNGIYEVTGPNDARLIANISAFIRDNPVQSIPGDYDTDGQPYAMLADGDGFLVTEGNSNQLLRIGLDGAVERVVDLSEGHPIPTGLARAGDGEYYVAYFTSAPYPEGGAKVVSITRDGTITDTWAGLTLVTALTTGADGVLYALEMATGYGDDPVAIGPGTGRVVRQDGADGVVPIVTGLDLPAAMCFGPDGALYVSGPAFGADTGEGFILRIRLDQLENEPVLAPRISELAGAADC
ncbi:MAG TPA: ScyD/ScyE family protein [Thermomicrobiales bacterium]|nr:ScyD/ScyE family protein [Thermomicrobiales bacterium]